MPLNWKKAFWKKNSAKFRHLQPQIESNKDGCATASSFTLENWLPLSISLYNIQQFKENPQYGKFPTFSAIFKAIKQWHDKHNKDQSFWGWKGYI